MRSVPKVTISLRQATSGTRPVGVITSIEGISKHELQKRCVVVEYAKQPTSLPVGPIERAIEQHRHEIGSALVMVLRRYMEIKDVERGNSPNPIPEFEEHFGALCHLLMAYADAAGKPQEWAKATMDTWDRTLSQRKTEENDLEHPLLRLFNDPVVIAQIRHERITRGGFNGTLYITATTDLLTHLQQLNLHDLSLPKNSEGLGRRLRSSTFQGIEILDEQSAPDWDCLKRKAKARPVGIFIADDETIEETKIEEPEAA